MFMSVPEISVLQMVQTSPLGYCIWEESVSPPPYANVE